MSAFDHLESALYPEPLFFVQSPDGRKDWSEVCRQATLFSYMRVIAPRVFGFPIPNAGKRNPRLARKEGIVAGVFDTQWFAPDGRTAFIELKGYSKAGRAGKLTPAQIEFGNRMHAIGVPVACFYNPYDAVDWLRNLGFPVGCSV